MVMVSNMYGGVCGNIVGKHLVVFTVKQATFVQCNTAVGKPEGKSQLGRPRRRWVDNIRTDLQEMVCGYMDWIGLAQDRDGWWTLVSAVMNLRVP
jgi:hypothetical protein